MKTLALDIGGSKLIAAAVDVFGDRIELGMPAFRKLEPSCTKEQLLTLIDEVVVGIQPVEFENIGVTIPGLADPERGLWVYACFSGISDFPIAAVLSERYHKPVFIENDVNACALAEKKFGVCKTLNDFLWVTVSNGVGGGLILNGNLYSGHFGSAAEIGHFGVVTNEESAFQCGCGNRGCLEAQAAGPGIVRRYKQTLPDAPPDITAKEIIELARCGSKTALSVVETAGTLLGIAASYAVNLLNLEAVVFGGGVMQSFDVFQPFIEKAFNKHLFQSANPSVQILQTGLGYNAALAGAAAIVKK
ncbi:MAG: ROK family protein [Planctomycetaceae bacterium]|nr:ROK family protein [Planctomycetaceae bacterium]